VECLIDARTGLHVDKNDEKLVHRAFEIYEKIWAQNKPIGDNREPKLDYFVIVCGSMLNDECYSVYNPAALVGPIA